MNPVSCKKSTDLAILYDYKTDTDAINKLRDVTTTDLHLVGKINHGIFNIP